MCAILNRFFRVPWHNGNPRPFDVITMVSQPLLASLSATMISLNVMVFMNMNSRSFSSEFIKFSYGSCLAAGGSFIFFVLSIVYGYWPLVITGISFYHLFVLQHVVLSVHLLRTPALAPKVDDNVILIVRIVVVVVLLFTLLLTLRLAMVTCALIEATMQGGKMWDIDEVKRRSITVHNRNHSVEISQED